MHGIAGDALTVGRLNTHDNRNYWGDGPHNAVIGGMYALPSSGSPRINSDIIAVSLWNELNIYSILCHLLILWNGNRYTYLLVYIFKDLKLLKTEGNTYEVCYLIIDYCFGAHYIMVILP